MPDSSHLSVGAGFAHRPWARVSPPSIRFATFLLAVVTTVTCSSRPLPPAPLQAPPPICPPPDGIAATAFHGGADRLGWNSHEPTLTPAAVASNRFGLLWQSQPFDAVELGGTRYP